MNSFELQYATYSMILEGAQLRLSRDIKISDTTVIAKR